MHAHILTGVYAGVRQVWLRPPQLPLLPFKISRQRDDIITLDLDDIVIMFENLHGIISQNIEQIIIASQNINQSIFF